MLSTQAAIFAGLRLLTFVTAQSDMVILPTPVTSGSGVYACPSPNAHHCIPGALDLIIHCNSSSLGGISNCNDVLSGLENMGQNNAFCYDQFNGDGQAACAISGTAYASTTTFALPVGATDPFTTVTPVPTGGGFVCPSPGGSYCEASNIIAHCNSSGLATFNNCNDVLVAYGGEKNLTAFCYDAVPNDGEAACAVSGTVYGSTTTYAIPTSSSSGSTSQITTVETTVRCSSSVTTTTQPGVPPSSVSSVPPQTSVLTGEAIHLTVFGAAALVGAIALAL